MGNFKHCPSALVLHHALVSFTLTSAEFIDKSIRNAFTDITDFMWEQISVMEKSHPVWQCSSCSSLYRPVLRCCPDQDTKVICDVKSRGEAVTEFFPLSLKSKRKRLLLVYCKCRMIQT